MTLDLRLFHFWNQLIFVCLTDIPQSILDKPEMLYLPGKASPIHDFSINVSNPVQPATRTARNLAVPGLDTE